MNEMLANQYFIAERFLEASYEFEEVLKVYTTNSLVKKKLILCYIQVGKLPAAAKLFIELITSDIHTIINNEINIYNQPCKKMIYELENLKSDLSENDKMLMLGILWMYCDVNNAKLYFEKLSEITPNDFELLSILKIINQLIPKKNKEKRNGKENLLS